MDKDHNRDFPSQKVDAMPAFARSMIRFFFLRKEKEKKKNNEKISVKWVQRDVWVSVHKPARIDTARLRM
jgi:hypothetical protein